MIDLGKSATMPIFHSSKVGDTIERNGAKLRREIETTKVDMGQST
ncbi:MAG TPA: hypothetical protein VK136_04605 [Bacillota bacterium]|nr:hypothetical protein [Bacillota bacterium]